MTVRKSWMPGALGASGVTILESTGIGRVRQAGMRDDLPLMPSLRDLFESQEERHRTLFSVVSSQEMVDKMVATSQEVIGDLDDPHTGFLFVTPVLQAYGLGVKIDPRPKGCGSLVTKYTTNPPWVVCIIEDHRG
jgi:hypothetical protein